MEKDKKGLVFFGGMCCLVVFLCMYVAVVMHKRIFKLESERICVAGVIYTEARNQPREVWEQIYFTLLNRKRSRHFPNELCKVAFQKNQFQGLKHGLYINNMKLFVKIKKMVDNFRREINNKGYLYFRTYPFKSTQEKIGAFYFSRTWTN